MKNSTKILIGIVVVALVGVGLYFGNTKLQKGSLIFPKLTIPDFTIDDIKTGFIGSDYLSNDKINWLVKTENKGACFKDSEKVSKKVKVELWGFYDEGNKVIAKKAKPIASDPNDPYGYLWQDKICDKGWVGFTFDNLDALVKVQATIDNENKIYELSDTNNSRTEKGRMEWVEEQ